MDMKMDAFKPTFLPTTSRVLSALEKGTAPAAQGGEPKAEKETARDGFFPNSDRLSMLEEMLKNSRDQSEQSAESFDDLGKCMTIAARIMNGDTVPQKDHKFLAEKYPELYEQAILMRRINHDPKKYKSLVEDDEEETAEETSAVTGEAAGSAPREEVLGAVPAEESAVLSE